MGKVFGELQETIGNLFEDLKKFQSLFSQLSEQIPVELRCEEQITEVILEGRDKTRKEINLASKNIHLCIQSVKSLSDELQKLKIVHADELQKIKEEHATEINRLKSEKMTDGEDCFSIPKKSLKRGAFFVMILTVCLSMIYVVFRYGFPLPKIGDFKLA